MAMYRLNLNFKISSDILDSQGSGGPSSLTLTICTLNLNFKISGEILGSQEGEGGQASLTMCTLNLNFKISGKILGHLIGRSIIFDLDHVHTKSKL